MGPIETTANRIALPENTNLGILPLTAPNTTDVFNNKRKTHLKLSKMPA